MSARFGDRLVSLMLHFGYWPVIRRVIILKSRVNRRGRRDFSIFGTGRQQDLRSASQREEIQVLNSLQKTWAQECLFICKLPMRNDYQPLSGNMFGDARKF